jgi:ABC-type nitrate/sulfonate/bicarbonate transport system substrate-binding protein
MAEDNDEPEGTLSGLRKALEENKKATNELAKVLKELEDWMYG